MLKRIFLWLLGIVLVSVAAGAAVITHEWKYRPWFLNVFYEKVFVRVLFENPELLSALGIAEKFGITSHNGKLGDASPAKQIREFAQLKQDLADLRAYPLDQQSDSQKMSTRVLEWFLARQVEGEKFQWHNYPVNQLFGIQNQMPSFLANTHRLFSARDCEYYLMRLEALPVKYDQVLEGLKLREQKGITPPRFVVGRVLKEMREFVATPPPRNILASSFRDRAAKIKEVTETQRAAFQQRVETAITARVYPAYQRLIDYFAALEPKATTDDGVWKLPDGEAFYAHMLRQSTTTTLKPNEIHEIGLREVARIEGEMRTILDAQGHLGRTVGEWMTELGKDPKFQFSADDKGRTDAIAEYTRIIVDSTERSKQIFRTIPAAKVEVRRIPVFKEATAPGAYYEGAALDGKRPGVFYANLRDMGEVAKWSMRTLAYHEAVPGHHFQIATAQELKGLPQFRKLIPFTAYAEGWALYTEWLAKENGWYEGDPYGDLGRLQAELFRGVRLVVDTGIHAQRWTREKAIAYMLEKTGMGEKDVTSEIERYIVMPGQACAYKVGMLKIQELRRRAQQALGAKFDQRDFHDVVLKGGSLPLDILEDQVNNYILRVKG